MTNLIVCEYFGLCHGTKLSNRALLNPSSVKKAALVVGVFERINPNSTLGRGMRKFSVAKINPNVRNTSFPDFEKNHVALH
jgi:hypothetical protein